jgi:hypothetical protein
VAGGGDGAGAVEEAPLDGVGGGCGVAGAEAGAERGERAWARTQSMMPRSTLRLTVEDGASAQKERMISASRCSMVFRRAYWLIRF